MNKFSKLFLAFAASTMVLTGCSSEEPASGVVTPTEGNLYTTLTIQLPTGSRSSTVTGNENTNSDAGYEIGNDKENNVEAVFVVIAAQKEDGTYGYITSNLADAHTALGSSQTNPIYNIQFETRALYDYAGTGVYVFAYCNPTRTLVEAAKTWAADFDFTNEIGDITVASISTANGFFMSNALISTSVTLPSQDEMNKLYNTPENPFNLGTVKVERATARFDFRQTTVAGQTIANYYPIYNHSNSDLDAEGNVVTKDGPVAYIQLTGMALLNESKKYYLLPRVSNNGLPTGEGFELCGRETPNNYVISPNFELATKPQALNATDVNDSYLYTGLAASAQIDFTTFNYEALGTNLGDDDDEHWNMGDGVDKTGFKIWKYVSENTIPAFTYKGENNYQRLGVTTGIVFQGELKATEANTDLQAAMTAGKVLYAFNGKLYGDLAMLKNAVLAAPVSTLADQFMAQFNVTEITEKALEEVTEDLENTVANGFAIYRPTNGKYYMYYTYKNRHNDNANNNVMFPMEFSVVRNNVYKLAVSNILEFGHPGKPGDDPDPEDPDDPDETPKTYFRVQVQVLPWVVRVNNIIL